MRVGFTIDQILEWFPNAEKQGSFKGTIERIASLKEAGPGDLTFLGNPRYQQQARETKASVVLMPRNFEHSPSAAQMLVKVDDPSLAIGRICEKVFENNKPPRKKGIHPTAVVSEEAQVDPDAWVGPHCLVEAGASIAADCILEAQVYIGRNVKIGRECMFRPQVVVESDSIIGQRCIFHPGVVIGGEGFGYHSSAEGHQKIPQVGCVVIEDDVEMGANSTVDRARFAETRIGQGTKIDNLVQIGHNVTIGKHGILCAFAGVSGSSHLGNFVTLAGQVGVVGHIHIGDNVMVGGQSGVARNLESGGAYTGTPARPLMDQRRMEAWVRRIPDIHAELEALKRQVTESSDGN
jgi:UDP-3-O-[3-hydroxymyristoyl] glucosamine N-acyltransferase